MLRIADVPRWLRLGWLSLPTADFRLRSEAALTHPVTLLSLGVLLVNDHVLKSIWPGTWITGKLSDLAWLIFAVPLLAWLLSLVARDSRSQRYAFIASYLGLPALYLVFNTFEPVHNAILTAITTPFGLTPGSPRDSTDSIVIPLALGIAFLIWRASSADKAIARRKWVALVTAAAMLASVATSIAEPRYGITYVTSTVDGALIAGEEGVYRSDDGGWTWMTPDTRVELGSGGGRRVDTPRGTYEISEAGVVRIAPGGEPQVVYSTTYLKADANVWMQWLDTDRLGYRVLSDEPLSIAYDQRTGNLVVALGLQGVAVGTPDNEWTRVAVGRFTPTDFSFQATFPILVSTPAYWLASLALSLALIAVALLYSQRETTEFGLSPLLFGLILLLITLLSPILFMFSVITIPTLVILGAVAISKPATSAFRAVILSFLAAAAVSGSFWALTLFSSLEPNDWVDDFLLYSLMFGAYVFGFFVLMASLQNLGQLLRAIPFFALMNALILLSFMIWLRFGLDSLGAALLATALASASGFVLLVHLRSKLPPPGLTPSPSSTEPDRNSDSGG